MSLSVSTKTLGSNLGTGGMETKLIAAEIATAAGVATVICNSKHPERIFEIIEYNNLTRPKVSSAPSTPREPLSGRTSPVPGSSSKDEDEEDSTGSQERTPAPQNRSLPPLRPPHTLFIPSPMPLRDLKSWTSHTLAPSGSVIIDHGAHLVLSRRDSGGRLLPAGVLGVRGSFAAGQAVRIVVRRRKAGALPVEETDNTTKLAHATMAAYQYADGSPIMTQPSTPTLVPAASMTSSISTLEHFPHSVSSLTTASTINLQPQAPGTPEEDLYAHHDNEKEEDEGWELVEVGRGLTNYNSAQIRRVRGMKR